MRPTFEEAKAAYMHRFTCEHVPLWAHGYLDDRSNPPKFYAPHYRTDREWYDNTKFPGEEGCPDKTHCISSNKSWPHTTALAEQFVIGKTPAKWKPKQLVLRSGTMIKHKGWGMTMGRTACGRKPQPEQITMVEDRISCRICLRAMIGEERRDVRRLQNELAIAEGALRQLERQLERPHGRA